MAEAEGGEGVEVPKIYHLASKVPGWSKRLIPKKWREKEIHEEARNAYPYCRIVLSIEDMEDNFIIITETYHKEGRGDEDNVHELEVEKLKERTVIPINTASDLVNANDYNEDEDPNIYKSEKTGRGPLGGDWKKSVMIAYKLVTVQVKVWGFHVGTVENHIHTTQKRLFTNFHRQMFCWTDKWYGKTMDDISALCK